MGVLTLRPDDPEFAQFVARSAARTPVEGVTIGASFDPRFGDYIQGKLDAPPAEVKMAELKRATKDEVIELPDGRLIQVQAKGAPVDEKLAERERELLQRSKESEESADPLREITVTEETHVIGARALVPDKAATVEKGKK